MKKEILILIFIGILYTSLSSAEVGCCSLTSENIACAQVEENLCPIQNGSIFSPNIDCSSASFCVPGCCYDSDLGIYDRNVLENDCPLEWVDDPNCNLFGAELGCCVLGTGVDYTTQRHCTQLSTQLGLTEVDWREDVDLNSCLQIERSKQHGACVLENGECSLLSGDECYDLGGNFYEHILCTSEELNTSCEPTTETSCFEGYEEVYFKDSCGNRANIYDSSRANDQSYWNEEIPKSESCNFNAENGNANSPSCGNCDISRGGFCSRASSNNFEPDLGNYYCRDVSCEFKNKTYQNGESWCDYDGAIGNGDDVVGSRHFKYTCSQGEVIQEPCGDYRSELCIQSIEENEEGESFSNAACVANNWKTCLDINSQFEGQERVIECQRTVNCMVESVNIAEDFHFNACVPQYPPGFDLRTEENAKKAKDVCNIGTKTCKVYRKKTWYGKCKVKKNGNCLSQTFSHEMNNFCTSIGDCGGKVNIAGRFRKNYIINGAPDLSQQYISLLTTLSNRIPGQYAIVENYSTYLSVIGIDPLSPEYSGLGEATIASYSNKNIFATLIGLSLKPFELLNILVGGNIWDKLWGKCSTKNVDYICRPWQPPFGGDDCELCNTDPNKPCSKYRCNSLGASCEFLNEDSPNIEDRICVSVSSGDVSPPKIEPLLERITPGYKYENIIDSGFEITTEDGGCVDPYTDIEFGIKTDEPALCKWDFEETGYDNMSNDFGNIFLYNHTVTLNLPDPSHGQAQGSNWTGDLTMFIKCKNPEGIENPLFYEINFCVNQGPDITSPRITHFFPEDNSLVSFDEEEKLVVVATNELAICRWDFSDKEFFQMQGQMNCTDELGYPSTTYGYICGTTLPITSSENTYFFRCADQPWALEEGSNNSNINEQGTAYHLNKPSSRIKIESVEPNSDFEILTDHVSLDLIVQTSGGGNEHTCSFSINGASQIIPFFETGGTVHIQPVNLYEGSWSFYIECRDELGDKDNTTINFEIKVDDSIPVIARIWNNAGDVSILTIDPAECRYSTENCDFDFEEGISIGSGTSHHFTATAGKEYFIKCMEENGYVPKSCSVNFIAV